MINRILFGNMVNSGDFIIMSSGSPYIGVSEILSIVEDFSDEDGTFTREFRWSKDGKSFSQWTDLTIENVQSQITGPSLDKFWIEFKYNLLSDGNVGIVSVNLNVTFKTEPMTAFPFPIAYPRDKGNRHWPIRMRNFSWNPYKQEAAIKLQKDLSLLVNQIHGHEVTYFKAEPDPKSTDVIFMEYTLHNVTKDPKCIKVVVPENTFPEHKLNMNAFGIDYEMPLEVHIDKRYFESIFGQGAKPQKRDIIYFPLTNRMYEVSSSTISVQFMYDFLYWQLNLVKWQPKMNVIQPPEIDELLDSYTTGIDDMFGEDLKNTYKDITNPQQLKDKSNKFDDVRSYISPYSIHIPYEFKNYYTTIFEYYYDLNNHYIKDKVNPAIVYNAKCNLTENDNLTFTSWIRLPITNEAYKDIYSITRNSNIVEIKFNFGLPKIKVGEVLSVYDSINSDFGIFGVVTDIDSNRMNLTLTIEIDNAMLSLANTIYPNWESSNNLKGGKIIPMNLIDAYTNNTGISISIYDGRYINYKINDNIIWNPLVTKMQENVWYGIVIGLLNTFNQISYHLYKQRPKEDKTTILDVVSSQVINNVPSEDRTSTVNYRIMGSSMHITNIRILKDSLEGDLHSKFLNMQIIRDSSKAIIIDNATPRVKLPYVGITK